MKTKSALEEFNLRAYKLAMSRIHKRMHQNRLVSDKSDSEIIEELYAGFQDELIIAYKTGAADAQRDSFPLSKESWKEIVVKLNEVVERDCPQTREQLCQTLLPRLIDEYKKGYIVERVNYVWGSLTITVILSQNKKKRFKLMPLLIQLEAKQREQESRLSALSNTNITMQQDLIALSGWVSQSKNVPPKIKKIAKARLKEIGG